MKLHFESDLDYQLRAIAAVCDLFRRQGFCRTKFTVTMQPPTPTGSGLFPGTRLGQLALDVGKTDMAAILQRRGIAHVRSL